MPRSDRPYRFNENADVTDRDRVLAAAIANQQRAGFRDLLDVRPFSCPTCNAVGFNSGWGAIDFACGSSWSGGEDAECFEPCAASASKAA